MRRLLFTAGAVFAASISSAQAVGFMTQLSCASDYYAYCSKHPVGSKELRGCMNANGPKLSKSCINALIADGEITKEEVMRRRDELIALKKPAKPQPKIELANSDVKTTDAAKAKPVRQPDVKSTAPPPVFAPVRIAAGLTLTLDQKTFEALKSRGNQFIVDANDVVPTSMDEPRRAIAEIETPTTEDVPVDEIATAPAIAATVPPVSAAEALAPGPNKSEGPAEAPAGKMALGKKPSIEPEAPSPVEVIQPPKPSSAETWLNYMKNRYEGRLNYEGVDANF